MKLLKPVGWLREWVRRLGSRPNRHVRKTLRTQLSVMELEDRTVPTTFTMTSPTSAGALPSGVTEVGGMVIDIIGLNGVRVVTEIAAAADGSATYNLDQVFPGPR